MNRLGLIGTLLVAFPVFGQTHNHKSASLETECKGIVRGIVLDQNGERWSGINLILEPFGDYDYILPRARTNERGEYRFERGCAGKWGVFIEDKEAGYPHSGRLTNWFLYGKWSPAVEITNKDLDVQLNVDAPPKPGILVVHLADKQSKAKILRATIFLKVNRKRWAQMSCDNDSESSCDGGSFWVPPDTDVKLRITSHGFGEWRGTRGRGEKIHLSDGEVLTLRAELTPARN